MSVNCYARINNKIFLHKILQSCHSRAKVKTPNKNGLNACKGNQKYKCRFLHKNPSLGVQVLGRRQMEKSGWDHVDPKYTPIEDTKTFL